MKKISLFILIIILIGITSVTVYTLTHRTITGTQTIRKVKSIEKATSNMTENELSEIYNIELNGKRHKLKCVYHADFNNKTAIINLILYLDGFEIFNEEIENDAKAKNIEEIFAEENNDIRIDETNLKIMQSDKDYLLVEITSNIENTKQEYFVWNEKREAIIEHVLVHTEEYIYSSLDEEELNIFYDEKKQMLAKIDDNILYVLEEKSEEEQTYLEEYIYTINEDKAEKELINTYEVKKEQQKKPN